MGTNNLKMENSYFVRGEKMLHVNSKLISTKLTRRVHVMTPDDALVGSQLENSTSLSSRLVSVRATNDCHFRKCSFGDSDLNNTKAEESHGFGMTATDSIMIRSSVYNSELMNAQVFDSLVNDSRVFDSNLAGCTIGGGDITGCNLRHVTVEEGVTLYGLTTQAPLYFKHGYWERLPVFVDHPDLLYLVQEDVSDRVLIGCQSRTINFWLNLTDAQVESLGVEFATNVETYREAVRIIAQRKVENPSPVSNVLKLDTPEWTLNEKSFEKGVDSLGAQE